MKNLFIGIALLFGTLVIPPPLPAAEPAAPLIAVAANFTAAMEKITDAYEKQTGRKVERVYSSTGKLYAQIRNGAPYDLFLAADERRPELLAREGFCDEPFTYAVGQAVLWSRNLSAADDKNWRAVVAGESVKKIAISTPETAPYGAAAMSALKNTGLLPLVEAKLVYGHNVAQPFQFAFQGAADLGFTALSLALSEQGRQGHYWLIPEAPAVTQNGCVITKSSKTGAVADFMVFFRSPETRNILTEYGYR